MGLQNGICPNCGSDQILVSKKPKLMNGVDGFVGWFVKLRKNALILKHYVCKNCHLMESYVDDTESMALIINEWDDLNTSD